MFQVIEFSQFRDEDVYHDITVVHCYPMGVMCSFHKVRLAAFLYADGFADRVLNGQCLVGRTSLTDNEILADSVFNV